MIAENLLGFETLPQNLPSYCIESFRRHAKPDALNYYEDGSWKSMSGEIRH